MGFFNGFSSRKKADSGRPQNRDSEADSWLRKCEFAIESCPAQARPLQMAGCGDLLDHDPVSWLEHDLFGKPVPTFPDHALEMRRQRFGIFLREAIPAS